MANVQVCGIEHLETRQIMYEQWVGNKYPRDGSSYIHMSGTGLDQVVWFAKGRARKLYFASVCGFLPTSESTIKTSKSKYVSLARVTLAFQFFTCVFCSLVRTS